VVTATAPHDLAERRGITFIEARIAVGRWLFERQQHEGLG
jgi:hypothetical protein